MVNLRHCFFLYPGSKAPDYFFNTPKKLFNNLCVTDTYHLFLFSLCLKKMAVGHKNYDIFMIWEPICITFAKVIIIPITIQHI